MARLAITLISIFESSSLPGCTDLTDAARNRVTEHEPQWIAVYSRDPSRFKIQRMDEKGTRAGASPSTRASQFGDAS